MAPYLFGRVQWNEAIGNDCCGLDVGWKMVVDFALSLSLSPVLTERVE